MNPFIKNVLVAVAPAILMPLLVFLIGFVLILLGELKENRQPVSQAQVIAPELDAGGYDLGWQSTRESPYTIHGKAYWIVVPDDTVSDTPPSP